MTAGTAPPIPSPDLAPSQPPVRARAAGWWLRGGAVGLATAVLLGTAPLRAQEAAPGAGASEAPAARSQPPKGQSPKDKHAQLEGLFAALKAAPDERSAKRIGDRLDLLFGDTGSPAVDLLMVRAGVAAEAKAYDLSLRILGRVLQIEPDNVAALSRRATIYYLKDEYGPALADVREVLAREPRHYGMLYGLALMLREMGEEKLALEAVRKALAANPHLDGARETEERLAITVEGRDI